MARPAHDPAGLPVVAVVPPDAPPEWANRLPDARLHRPGDEAFQEALSEAGVVLIDAGVEAPLAVARRVRRLAPAVQLILVAPADQSHGLRRSMLFTPGLGEPWLVEPDEVDPALVQRAAGITDRRRAHARQMDRVSGRVARLQHPPDHHPRRLSDQYLATLLEMLPTPVFALDEAGTILFANPAARADFPAAADPEGALEALALLSPEDPATLEAMLGKADEGLVRGQLRLRPQGARTRIYDVVLGAVPSERPVRAMVLHEVTEQVRAQEALAELAAERTAMLGNIADGVIIADRAGRIVFANEAAVRIHGARHLGIPPEEWATAYDLLTPAGEPYPSDALPLARAFRHGETIRDAEWLVRRPDGVVVHAQGSAAPVVARDGRPAGAVLTMRDVTEQRRREAEREELLAERDRALAELREAMRSRSRFYASMSHELRTPINAIIGYGDLLSEEVYGAVPPPQREALDRISRAARHLLELVNDVLDLSKVEAGKLRLEPQEVQVGALVRDLEATMQPLARAHGVELRFELGPDCDRPVRTDPRRLRQVVMNLLSNAIRYGAGRPVDVECQRTQGVRVSVRDRGPGIEPGQLEDIFEEFVQLGGAEGGGTGLGLAIARELARILGGDITAESEPGVGSVFTVTLPESPPEPGGDGPGSTE